MKVKLPFYSLFFSALAAYSCLPIAEAQIVLKKSIVQKTPTQVLPSQKPKTSELPMEVTLYSQEPFMLGDAEKLPNGYNGNDVKAIYKALQQKASPKGEFETTSQYQERVAMAAKEPLFGTLKPNSLFAICVDASSKYDADAATSTVTFSLRQPPILVSDFNKRTEEGMVVFSSDLLDSSTYEATNGYGAKATISKQEWDNYGLFLMGWKKIKLKPAYQSKYIESEPEGRFVIPMSVDSAKAAKGHLKVLVSFFLNEPYITDTDDFGGKTTIQNPYDIHYKYHLLRGTVQDVLLFNEETGEIVYKANK